MDRLRWMGRVMALATALRFSRLASLVHMLVVQRHRLEVAVGLDGPDKSSGGAKQAARLVAAGPAAQRVWRSSPSSQSS